MKANAETSKLSAPADSGGERFPKQIKYILGNEICERFSYYGVMGILELYLKDRMKMGSDGATEVLHYFGTAVYFLPLFGGWLADRYLGRFRTILSISLFYCLGHGCMAAFGGTRGGLVCGLALLAVGAGGIKPCVSAFVGDQFLRQDDRALTKVYTWFYWAINLGAAFAFFVIPIVRREAGYSWAFGVPGIFMALATVIFWLGRKQYLRQAPSRAAESVGLLRVFGYGMARLGIMRNSLTRAQEADAKTVWRILMIFITVPMFWALFNQVNSTWVLQGNAMIPAWRWKNDWLLNGETMQSAGSVLVMIWAPILTIGIYPLMERMGIKPTALRRMSAGMVLGAVAFVGSGILQAKLDQGARLSIAWQLVPYAVLEAGEVMLSATALEFAFSQAPSAMKSIITSFWLMTIAGGHFLVAAFTGLNENYIHARGAAEFYFFAVVMFVVAGIFIACAALYRRPEYEKQLDARS
ncbi:MAG: MFS transporter [Verrucomicrobiota bacterium]|jgi:POT family proton-dependent oligopeptide transporter